MKFLGYAALEPKGELKPFEFDPGELGAQEVQIRIESCGMCLTDLNLIDNKWNSSTYPLVAGHEVIGTIEEIGAGVTHLRVGQRVGVGAFSGSCMTCNWCLGGQHNLCREVKPTPTSRGGFADRIRADGRWVAPLPSEVDPLSAGPLFCAGLTVFNAIVECGVQPTDRVGVIGIGGLGHLALQYLAAWGCEVTAFSSNADKATEAREMGASHFVNSRDPAALAQVAGSLDFIMSTVDVALDWTAYLAALRPKGQLHMAGVVDEPIKLPILPMMIGQKSITSSPAGGPLATRQMLEFSARHAIEPIVQVFDFDQINEALEVLRTGAPRYRLVLKAAEG